MIAQCICLAVGLWAQQQFSNAVRNWEAQQAASGASELEISPTSSAWLVAGFTFIWTAGLQGSVAWLIIVRLKAAQDKSHTQAKEDALLRTKELIRTRDAVVFGLAKLAESRDPDTGLHLERIAMFSTRLAGALRRHRRYRAVVTHSFVKHIGISSALHDIGKVGVKDSILLKPGRLTTDERLAIQLHTAIGGECIEQIERHLGNSNFLHMAREIAFHHHERWDGKGYPAGLKEEEIPLSARIVAIADVYDALSVRRVYKEALPHEECVRMIEEQAGKQFDPELVEVFLTIAGQFRDIAERFREGRSVEHDANGGYKTVNMTEEQERMLIATVNEKSPSEPRLASSKRTIEVGSSL